MPLYYPSQKHDNDDILNSDVIRRALLDDDDLEYIDLDNPETDIEDEIYSTKCSIERQINLINGKTIKTGSGKDYKTTLNNMLNVIEEDEFLSHLELPSENIAVVKERYGENVKRKQRLDVVDSLFPAFKDKNDDNQCSTNLLVITQPIVNRQNENSMVESPLMVETPLSN